MMSFKLLVRLLLYLKLFNFVHPAVLLSLWTSSTHVSADDNSDDQHVVTEHLRILRNSCILADTTEGITSKHWENLLEVALKVNETVLEEFGYIDTEISPGSFKDGRNQHYSIKNILEWSLGGEDDREAVRMRLPINDTNSILGAGQNYSGTVTSKYY